MTTDRQIEAPLSATDVRKILSICSPRGLLVGGQALAFWADHLAVRRPSGLSTHITADADFIGDSVLAKEVGSRLAWRTWIPEVDDPAPHTGRLTYRLAGGRVKQVDFLSGVVGLSTKDLIRRAIEMEVPQIGHLRVIHPIDVLDSRIQNLHSLREKRTETGIAQAGLAIDVARTFIREQIARNGERVAVRLLERVTAIAADIAAIRVYVLYGIDPLQAAPLEDFRTTSGLHRALWPQIVANVSGRREALERLRTEPRHDG